MAARTGETALTYNGLHAYDATGRDLEASMEVGEGEIRLQVKDRGAVDPITIDPLVQQQKLMATEPVVGDQFGLSVAISGNRAIVGAHSDNSVTPGAAYIFERNRGGLATGSR